MSKSVTQSRPSIENILRAAQDAATSAAVRDVIASAMRDHCGCPNSVCNHPNTRRHPLELSRIAALTL